MPSWPKRVGTAAGSGVFQLDTQANNLGTVSTNTQANTVQVLDDGGFAVGGLSVLTAVTLRSAGTVTQTACTGLIATTTLTLDGGAATQFLLASANNNATLVVSNAVDVFEFRTAVGER